MGRSRLIVALFVFTAACQSQSGDDGWIELFNGENMDDWTVKVRGHPVSYTHLTLPTILLV